MPSIGWLSKLLGPKVWMGAMLGIALIAAGYVGWVTWQRYDLEVRLNEATVEVIRQDALLEKQNEYAHRLQDDGNRQNMEANERALLVLRPDHKPEPKVGAEALNKWLEGYKDD